MSAVVVLKGWAKLNNPEDVRIFDIFTLQNGKRIQINEIRRIQKHGVFGIKWEFIDREGKLVDWKEFEWIYDEDI